MKGMCLWLHPQTRPKCQCGFHVEETHVINEIGISIFCSLQKTHDIIHSGIHKPYWHNIPGLEPRKYFLYKAGDLALFFRVCPSDFITLLAWVRDIMSSLVLHGGEPRSYGVLQQQL